MEILRILGRLYRHAHAQQVQIFGFRVFCCQPFFFFFSAIYYFTLMFYLYFQDYIDMLFLR